MARGIIYIMSTIVPGLIKIGKTGSDSFSSRMYQLEHNGYRNITGLKREFAIEVNDYDSKETLLQNIFEKSRVGDTELFSLDINIVKSLLSSFDGVIVYPKSETKEEIFSESSEKIKSKLIPDGTYILKRKRQSDDGKMINATAIIKNGEWTLLKGSILGISEGIGGSQKAKNLRKTLNIDENGILLEDAELGECTPSFAGNLVMNQANNGWVDWKNKQGQPLEIYRKKENND